MADDSMALGYALGQDSNNRNDGGMWGDNGWWAIILFAMIFGWGNGGWGGGFGNNGAALNGALTRADLCSEFNFNGLENAVRGVQQGICDSTFALNNTIVNGFNGVQRDMCTGFSNVATGINENRFAAQQGFNNLQAQLASCCCETQRQVERGFCDTNYNLATNTTSIIQNAHNDTDRVIAKLDAMEMSRKDETIAALRSQIDALNLAQSQANQNNYLVNTLRPCPTPAYISCNPWAAQAPYGSCYTQGFGCGNGCGTCGC